MVPILRTLRYDISRLSPRVSPCNRRRILNEAFCRLGMLIRRWNVEVVPGIRLIPANTHCTREHSNKKHLWESLARVLSETLTRAKNLAHSLENRWLSIAVSNSLFTLHAKIWRVEYKLILTRLPHTACEFIVNIFQRVRRINASLCIIERTVYYLTPTNGWNVLPHSSSLLVAISLSLSLSLSLYLSIYLPFVPSLSSEHFFTSHACSHRPFYRRLSHISSLSRTTDCVARYIIEFSLSHR